MQAGPAALSSSLPYRIDFNGSAWLITGVKDEHTAKTKPSFRRKLLVGIIAFFLAFTAWLLWEIYAFNNAVQMAKEAGFELDFDDPISLIRKDWRNALEKKTWGPHDRVLSMRDVSDLDAYREMLHNLRPTYLYLNNCNRLQNVDGLRNLTSLVRLELRNCIELQNVDGLKGLTALREIELANCNKLKNVDGLKSLSQLKDLHIISKKEIHISSSSELQNVDSLKYLTSLEVLILNECTELKNVDALKGLSTLIYLDTNGCNKISATDLRELRAALPKTHIIFPDGAFTPPQD